VLDSTGTLPGRGAYLCRGDYDGDAAGEPAAECLALAARRGSVARALRCAATLTFNEPRASAKLVESISR
jgi:predicted RNA-binding protein YlxR (DUF448 family)